ncbi:MAG: valine--tRNA ligase [Dehalococcoidia bacterium]|nr:valine--tRNA ligase [Dehalococcoidia bacterium]
MAEMAKAYDPSLVEDRIYQFWLDRGYFTPEIDPSKEPFTIIMPPPNVTGALHLGHALTATIEDILIRWHRMKGDPTLWLPGTDHAAIAAQVVVERELAKEGLSRQELGRERFLERMWEWMRTYGKVITEQHKKLGASCDWSRERFTLDPISTKAVRQTFYNLYHKGLIYRGERMINWSPVAGTVLSDLEVDYREIDGHLWHVRYPIEPTPSDPEQRWITVATTRPETILGDTAVAVHPDDPRHRHLIDRYAILPVIGRRIPIIADFVVDPTFGTGAVKVTPAHDPTDFEIGNRHNLPRVMVMNLDATMNAEAGPYQGLDRYVARKRLVADLQAGGYLVKVEPYRHAVGHSGRTGEVVEPIVSLQWWLRMAPLAEPALRAVEDGQITIIPERFTKIYTNWLENIRDWCISRQIWWGFRIPVWYCRDCGAVCVPLTDITECTECRSPNVEQDPDSLDTWFSSALWPHSTLGWPDNTPDYQYFYPTSVMETGYDILFFWVARMVMMSIENTGKVPFRTVYLHGLVRDEEGRKMSKSLGNVIDPLEVMQQYGTDALRIALVTGSTPGNDSRISATKLEAGRSFVNKLWNAARFVISLQDGVDRHEAPLKLGDRWILSRLQRVIADVTKLLGDFQLGEAARVAQEFFWDEFCDWYLEVAKVEAREAKESGLTVAAPEVAWQVLDAVLRLFHPYAPFATEEIWRYLAETPRPHGEVRPEALIIAPWPTPDPIKADIDAETGWAILQNVIRVIRNVRAEEKVAPNRWIPATIVAHDRAAVFAAKASVIRQLARVRPLTIVEQLETAPKDAIALIVDGAEVYLPREGLADVDAERARLQDEAAKLANEEARLTGKLDNPEFVAKAPPAVVAKERERLASVSERLAKIRARLAEIDGDAPASG